MEKNYTKYDILKEMKNNSVSYIECLFKGILLLLKSSDVRDMIDDLFDDEFSDSRLIVETAGYLNCILPALMVSLHTNYENMKDLVSMDESTLYNYLKSIHIDLDKFSINYREQLNMNIKALLIFALMNRDGVSIPNFNNPKVAKEMIKGKTAGDIVKEFFCALSSECLDLMEEVLNKEYEIKLTAEQQQLLDEYHNDFMTKFVYPHVSNSDLSKQQEQQALKIARCLARKSPRRKLYSSY